VTELARSCRWWRRHGGQWPEEIRRRLRRLPYYHIQQILLAEALSRCAPARVLEFGCGFGRHLAYLRRIDGLTLHGCDQSPTMLAGVAADVRAPAGPAHLAQNDPLFHLPYKDKAFDVAYTVNVLLHVPPGDAARVAAELVRVTRSRILHLEPARDQPLDAGAHDGCFIHDHGALYAALGLHAAPPQAYCRIQEAVVVDLDDRFAQPVWSEALLTVLRRLDADLTRDDAAAAIGLEIENNQLTARLRAVEDRLRAVEGSRAWRLGYALARTPLGRLADRVLGAFGR